MFGCISALLLAIALALLWRRSSHRTWLATERLVTILETVARGEDPGDEALAGLPQGETISDRIRKMATEARQLREQMAREAINYQTVLSCMEEGLMVVDARHVLRQTNPSFLRLFDVKGDPCGETVLRTIREPEVEEVIRAALLTSEPQSREFTRHGLRQNSHFAIYAVPMRDSSGQPGVVTVFRDISRLRQLEEVRRDFVANVSHELRTPLAIFHGYVENLLDEPKMPRPAQLEIFEIISRHSRRLNALLEDLLVLARLESRHDRLETQPIAFDLFMAGILSGWTARGRKKHISLRLEIPPGLPQLEADPLRLEQVFDNLLENGVKYTHSGGKVAIRAVALAEHLEVRVADTGLGIPPADLPHIFERFYRADKARTRVDGGTGLGLSIVKHIVQLHGGTVRAESTYEKGTTIILQIPFQQGMRRLQATPPAAEPSSHDLLATPLALPPATR